MSAISPEEIASLVAYMDRWLKSSAGDRYFRAVKRERAERDRRSKAFWKALGHRAW